MIGALAAVAVALAAPPVAQVSVSAQAGTQAETAAAASPVDPAVLLAGSNSEVAGAFDTLAYTSTDHGATWTSSRPFAGSSEQCAVGDPVVSIDEAGRQLYGYLVARCANPEADPKISLYVSTRPGPAAPWSPVLVADAGGGENDKPAIAWDVSAASPHHGRAYLAWTRLRLQAGRAITTLVVSHSDDAGATWSQPAVLRPSLGGASFFVGLAVAPDGGLYVDWVDAGRHVKVARSADGGDTFGPAVAVGSTAGLPVLNCRFNGLRIPAQARRCVTPSPSIVAGADRVVVAYAGAAGGSGTQLDVRARAFDLTLKPLGAAIRVHPADGKVAADQFLPVAAIDPHSGVIWLCYYDTRGDRTRRSAGFTCTASRDGLSWAPPQAVVSVRSNETRAPANVFQYGDYEGLAVGADGIAHPFWTDSRDLATQAEEIYTTALDAAAYLH